MENNENLLENEEEISILSLTDEDGNEVEFEIIDSIEYEGTEYLHNQPLPRFLLVTIISYIFMVIISIVGAVVPTAATIKRHPADALRE